jgi:hypothetical protein
VYHPLIQSGEGLFVRSSGSHRVVESAGYWLEVCAFIHPFLDVH